MTFFVEPLVQINKIYDRKNIYKCYINNGFTPRRRERIKMMGSKYTSYIIYNEVAILKMISVMSDFMHS